MSYHLEALVRPATILVVEDDVVFRSQLEAHLREQGHTVASAETLAGARALVGQQRFDLAILDIQLPDGLGTELAREIPHVPVLFVTSVAQTARVCADIESGALPNVVGYLNKPVALERLDATLTCAISLGRFMADQARMRKLTEASLETFQQELFASLHDDVSQRLVGLNLQVSLIRQKLSGLGVADERIEQLLAGLSSQLGELKGALRTLAREMTDGRIHHSSLAADLGELFEEWRHQAPGVQLSANLDPELDQMLPAADRALIYRVVQEALTNAYGHANPTRIEVSLSLDESRRLLHGSVADNGGGLVAGADSSGMGVDGMRRRIESLQGRLELVDAQDGAVLSFMVPLPQQEQERAPVAGDESPAPVDLEGLFRAQAARVFEELESPSSVKAWQRAMHTLGTSAQSMGFDELGRAARALETETPETVRMGQIMELKRLAGLV